VDIFSAFGLECGTVVVAGNMEITEEQVLQVFNRGFRAGFTASGDLAKLMDSVMHPPRGPDIKL
jgi:hypothetical protein